MQCDVFRQSEGDAFYARNRVYLETAVARDWVLKTIDRNGLNPQRVFEGGCCTGWRLAELQRRYGCESYGLDVSAQAIADGRRRWPSLALGVDDIASVGSWLVMPCDLVVVSFVFHWLDRSRLLAACSAMDAVLSDGGYLVIADFLPDQPTKVPYHHREGLWTYKCDYARLFEDTGNYRRVDRVIFDHDTGLEGDTDAYRRAVATLLRKEDCYEVGVGKP